MTSSYLILATVTILIHSVLTTTDDVRWLQYVHDYQTKLSINSSLASFPMCSTWLSNNYKSTRALNETVKNLSEHGKHCISSLDCISGELSFQNQGLSLVEQLDAGVRRLVLELHWVPGIRRKLRLCASVQG